MCISWMFYKRQSLFSVCGHVCGYDCMTNSNHVNIETLVGIQEHYRVHPSLAFHHHVFTLLVTFGHLQFYDMIIRAHFQLDICDGQHREFQIQIVGFALIFIDTEVIIRRF